MGTGSGVWRRRSRGLCIGILMMLVAGMAACSDDDDSRSSSEDAVAVGPGSDETAPVERQVEHAAGTEPAWARQLRDISRPQASAAEQLAVRDVAGSAALTAPNARPRAVDSVDYSGTMTIEIAYYNYCRTGSLDYAGSAEYELDADVFVNRSAEESGAEERSPFNLIVGTENGVEGTLSIVSATIVLDQRDGRRVLFDYWDINQNGDEIEGALTDRWPGVAMNTISTAQLIVPCQTGLVFVMPDTIAEGATMEGTVDDDEVDLQLIGQSFDREVRFRATIEAEREDS